MAAYASLFERVYALSPTFRDEQNSVNHLVEFRMLEGEILSMSYKELPDFVEELLVFLLNELTGFTETRGLSSLRSRLEALKDYFPIQKVSYEDFMCEICNAGDYKLDDGVDLRDIDYIVSKYLSRPVFVMNYPRSLASWTANRGADASMCAFNLILPETYGELCEGCERTNDVVMLRQKFQCAGIDNLQWYLAAVKNIDVPRCGFGIGMDRLVRWIVGAAHVKDTVLFPRMKLQ
jgi:asparaginyl-tRNA synthetase